LLDTEPLICQSIFYSYAYEIYYLFDIYVFHPKKTGLMRYVNQGGLLCLALAVVLAGIALVMMAVEYVRWVLLPSLYRSLLPSKKTQ